MDSVWLYGGFVIFVLAMLAIDLFLVNRKAHEVSVKAALGWTGVCIALALGFTVFVYGAYTNHWLDLGKTDQGDVVRDGARAASEFLQGWVLEYSLSVDNLFIIAVIFNHFRIPAMHQHRVLMWGIIGALVLRGVMIALGAELIDRFNWMLYVFGGFLLLTAVRMLMAKESEMDPDKSFAVRIARRLFPVTKHLDGQKFFTRVDGRLAMTPLFLVLLVVETTDVIFAVDSIPAIFGVTKDPFLVFTSNVFAILGLRSLFFALRHLLDRFEYLKYSLVVVLGFIGVKMLVSDAIHIDHRISLGVVLGVLTAGVAASLVRPRAAPQPAPLAPPATEDPAP